jgi:hypothetical protein
MPWSPSANEMQAGCANARCGQKWRCKVETRENTKETHQCARSVCAQGDAADAGNADFRRRPFVPTPPPAAATSSTPRPRARAGAPTPARNLREALDASANSLETLTFCDFACATSSAAHDPRSIPRGQPSGGPGSTSNPMLCPCSPPRCGDWCGHSTQTRGGASVRPAFGLPGPFAGPVGCRFFLNRGSDRGASAARGQTSVRRSEIRRCRIARRPTTTRGYAGTQNAAGW